MNEFSFTPFPKLQSKQFDFRQLQPTDADEIYLLRTDDEVNRYLIRKRSESVEDARQFINKINVGIEADESILWGITYRNQDTIVGTICLWNLSREKNSGELGYELLPQHHGKGIMQEVIPVIINYGFEVMKLDSILAELSPLNLKSVGLLLRNNFKQIKPEGEIDDSVVYVLHR